MNESNMQPHDVKEYSQEMSYKGSGYNGGIRRNGYVAGTHARVDDRARKDELRDIGLDTREEYVDAQAINAPRVIRLQRIKRICFIFLAMFVLAAITGLIIASFWGFDLLVGLGVGAAIGAVLFVLPMAVYLITYRRKNK